MPILELSAKLATLGLSAITGGTVLAVVEGLTEPKGVESHLTLATGAVICVGVLWAAFIWVVKALLKAKDDQIEAVRLRETKERERADLAEGKLREELAARAQRAEDDAANEPRHSTRR